MFFVIPCGDTLNIPVIYENPTVTLKKSDMFVGTDVATVHVRLSSTRAIKEYMLLYTLESVLGNSVRRYMFD